MIVSQAAGPSFIDAAPAPAAPSGTGNGAFALAVKDAGREKTAPDAKDAGPKDAETHKDGAAAHKTGRKPGTDGKTKGAKDEAADGEGGEATLTGDLLGRLLAGSLAATSAPAPRDDAGQAGEAPADDELQERLVISTVVDLAGAVEDGEATRGRVALEVLRMETHFEPGAGTAELVQGRDADAAAADAILDLAALADEAAAAPAKTGEAKAAAPKMSFDETLQKLGGQWTGSGGGGTSDGEARQQRGREPTEAVRASAGRGGGGEEAAVLRAAPAAGDRPGAGAAFPSMTDQIANRIIETLAPGSTGGSDAANRPAAGNEAYLRLTAGGAALKTLTIQLQPENLGQLDVSMRLVDGRLTLELAATQKETAQALAADRHGLKKLLEHAGFAVDDAAITVVTRERSAAAAPPASADGSGSGSSSGGEGGQRSSARDGEAGSGRQPQREPNDSRPGTAQRAPAGAVAAARGVFL